MKDGSEVGDDDETRRLDDKSRQIELRVVLSCRRWRLLFLAKKSKMGGGMAQMAVVKGAWGLKYRNNRSKVALKTQQSGKDSGLLSLAKRKAKQTFLETWPREVAVTSLKVWWKNIQMAQ
jgi:hypothetical protein